MSRHMPIIIGLIMLATLFVSAGPAVAVPPAVQATSAFLLADELFNKGDFPGAIEQAEKARAILGSSKPRIEYLLTKAYLAVGNYPKAYEALDAYFKVTPKSVSETPDYTEMVSLYAKVEAGKQQAEQRQAEERLAEQRQAAEQRAAAEKKRQVEELELRAFAAGGTARENIAKLTLKVQAAGGAISAHEMAVELRGIILAHPDALRDRTNCQTDNPRYRLSVKEPWPSGMDMKEVCAVCHQM